MITETMNDRTASRPPITVHNELTIHAPAEAVWDVLSDVEGWPTWYRACKWVELDSAGNAVDGPSFRWKAHPLTLRSSVVRSERPHLFSIVADGTGLHADRTFTLRRTGDGLRTVIVSHETQVGWLPWLARAIIAPRLHASNQAMFNDLAEAVGKRAQTRLRR